MIEELIRKLNLRKSIKHFSEKCHLRRKKAWHKNTSDFIYIEISLNIGLDFVISNSPSTLCPSSKGQICFRPLFWFVLFPFFQDKSHFFNLSTFNIKHFTCLCILKMLIYVFCPFCNLKLNNFLQIQTPSYMRYVIKEWPFSRSNVGVRVIL